MGGEDVEPVGLGWGGGQVLPDALQRADGEPLAVAETEGRIGSLNDKTGGGCEQGGEVADGLRTEGCGGGFGDKDDAVGGMFVQDGGESGEFAVGFHGGFSEIRAAA